MGLCSQGFISLLAAQFSAIVHSVAYSLQSDDLGVMQEAVEDGSDRRGVTEHLTPVFHHPHEYE